MYDEIDFSIKKKWANKIRRDKSINPDWQDFRIHEEFVDGDHINFNSKIDDVYEAIRIIFTHFYDFGTLIKWKELQEFLEKCLETQIKLKFDEHYFDRRTKIGRKITPLILAFYSLIPLIKNKKDKDIFDLKHILKSEQIDSILFCWEIIRRADLFQRINGKTGFLGRPKNTFSVKEAELLSGFGHTIVYKKFRAPISLTALKDWLQEKKRLPTFEPSK